jgi:two-component system OmpR family response regulator
MSQERNVPVILIIDDDPVLGDMVRKYLSRNDLSVSLVESRSAAVQTFDKLEPDLVVLDLQLRNEDGLDILRDIRQRGDTPVIIITGQKLDEIDRVVGLELGADDYLAKPFGTRELLARIRAILRRRSTELSHNQRKSERGKFRFNGWEVRLKTRQLLNPDGLPVQLTKGEYALLLAFLEAAQRPLTREQLLQATRVHEDIYDRSIDVQILRLRRKLEADPSMPNVIRTERGVGYLFALPVERS